MTLASPRGSARARPAAAAGSVVDVANGLRPVLLRLSRRLRQETHDSGVTNGQVSLLAAIRDHPGIGLADLAAHEGLSAPGVCVHIDRLEAAGYVSRSRGQDSDRRRVGLALTAEGQRVLRAIRSRRTAWLAARLSTLDEPALARVAEALEPLQRLLESDA